MVWRGLRLRIINYEFITIPSRRPSQRGSGGNGSSYETVDRIVHNSVGVRFPHPCKSLGMSFLR